MPDSPHKTSHLPVEIVDSSTLLDVAVQEMAGAPAMVLDTESNSLHRYPEQLCLIQIATLRKIYIIDTIALHAIDPLKEVLQDPAIMKIIHGADYDIRCLDRHYALRIKNLYDTSVAARFAGIAKFGLADLLKDLLDITILKSKQVQHADWGQRPLSKEALEYAAADVRHLFALQEILDKRIHELGRTSWVTEECSRLEEVRYAVPNMETAFFSVKGSQYLDGQGLAILRRLFLFREEESRRQRRPPFFILPDGALVFLAGNPAKAISEVPGLGPDALRRLGHGLTQAVRDGLKEPPQTRPTTTFECLSPEQSQRLNILKTWRESLSISLTLDPSLIWPTVGLDRLARAPGTLSAELESANIRRWQREQFASSLNERLNSLV